MGGIPVGNTDGDSLNSLFSRASELRKFVAGRGQALAYFRKYRTRRVLGESGAFQKVGQGSGAKLAMNVRKYI